MSDVATVISKLFVGTGGEAVASRPKGSQSGNKTVHQIFADAAPLTRLQEQTRSNKKQVAGTETQEQTKAPEDIGSERAPTESHAVGDCRQRESNESATEPADVSSSAKVQAAGSSEMAVTTDVAVACEHQSLSVVAQTSAAAGQVSNQAQVTAAVETTDGTQHSLQSEVTVSVGNDNAEVSAKTLVQETVAKHLSDNIQASATLAAGPEGAKADTVEATVKPQVQGRSEIQLPEEAVKDSGPEKVALTSQGPPTPPRSSLDEMPRKEGDSFSQQDQKAASHSAVQGIVTPEQGKGAPPPGSGAPLPSQAELTVVSEGDSMGATVRLPTQTPNVSGFDAAWLKSPVQDVGEQILSSVHASLVRADKQVQIRLDPPELGSVLVRLAEQGDQIRGFLEVSRDETRREIEQALPQVLKGLQEAGVQVRRLEVVVTDQSERGLGREPSQQDAWTQQQHADQHGYRPPNASTINWSAQTGLPQSGASRQGRDGIPTQDTQERIDMLV